MMEGNVERLRTGYDAWNRRDFDAAVAKLSPDVFWTFEGGTQLPGTDASYEGHAGVLEFWRTFIEPWEEVVVDIESIEEHGSTIAVDVRFRARGAESGIAIDGLFTHVWEFGEDGLATRFASRERR